MTTTEIFQRPSSSASSTSMALNASGNVLQCIHKAKRYWHLGNREKTFSLLQSILSSRNSNEIIDPDSITYSSLVSLICAILSSHTVMNLRLELDMLWSLALLPSSASHPNEEEDDDWPDYIQLRLLNEFMDNWIRLDELKLARKRFDKWLKRVSDHRLFMVLKNEKVWLDDVTECYLVRVLALGLGEWAQAKDFLFFNVYLDKQVKKRIQKRLEQCEQDNIISVQESTAIVNANSLESAKDNSSTKRKPTKFNWILFLNMVKRNQKQVIQASAAITIVTIILTAIYKSQTRRRNHDSTQNVVIRKLHEFFAALVNTSGL